MAALGGSVGSSTRPDAAAIAAEDRAVRFLARRIAENAAELQAATAEISALLERDETYRCLLAIPGIGPKTAPELAISVNIDGLPNHDRLASYCGLVPRNRQSGTSVSSVRRPGRATSARRTCLSSRATASPEPTGGGASTTRGAATAACAARQSAEGRREKEDQGDLRGHEGQGSVRRVGRFAAQEQFGPPGSARACPDFLILSKNQGLTKL